MRPMCVIRVPLNKVDAPPRRVEALWRRWPLKYPYLAAKRRDPVIRVRAIQVTK